MLANISATAAPAAATRFYDALHLLRVDDDSLVELRQITDTVSWGAP